MKRLLLTICYISFVLGCTAQPLMRDVFAAMPDTVLPLVTKNNRLDCIDYIENHMTARVRNKVHEYVTLEALTSDYARFRTSTAAVMELKLLPTSDSTAVLCMVTTAEAGEKETPRYVEDSNIRLLNADWSSLPADSPVSVASVKQARESDGFYVTEVADSIRFAVKRAQASLKSFRPVCLRLSVGAFFICVVLFLMLTFKSERTSSTVSSTTNTLLVIIWIVTISELECNFISKSIT